MRKIVLSIAALLVSVNVIAATFNLNSTISKAMQGHSANKQDHSLMYGGQDIHSTIATADQLIESQNTFMG